MTNFEKVGTFMKTFGQDVKQSSSFSTEKINELRVSLIKEELDELRSDRGRQSRRETSQEVTIWKNAQERCRQNY